MGNKIKSSIISLIILTFSSYGYSQTLTCAEVCIQTAEADRASANYVAKVSEAVFIGQAIACEGGSLLIATPLCLGILISEMLAVTAILDNELTRIDNVEGICLLGCPTPPPGPGSTPNGPNLDLGNITGECYECWCNPTPENCGTDGCYDCYCDLSLCDNGGPSYCVECYCDTFFCPPGEGGWDLDYFDYVWGNDDGYMDSKGVWHNWG